MSIKLQNNKFIYIYNHQKNSLMGTRCLTFEEVKYLRKNEIMRGSKVDLLKTFVSKQKKNH